MPPTKVHLPRRPPPEKFQINYPAAQIDFCAAFFAGSKRDYSNRKASIGSSEAAFSAG